MMEIGLDLLQADSTRRLEILTKRPNAGSTYARHITLRRCAVALRREMRHGEIQSRDRNRRWYRSTLGIPSQIDDDVAVRLRAANENVPVGRFVERLRSVDDHPRN